ncbi:MAG: phage tail assembly chaperone [Sphingomonadales bacterium]
MLGWSPPVFWRATLPELVRALDGWMLARGLKRDEVGSPLSRKEMQELVARFG